MGELTWAQGLGLSQSKNRVACKSMAQTELTYYERMLVVYKLGHAHDPVVFQSPTSALFYFHTLQPFRHARDKHAVNRVCLHSPAVDNPSTGETRCSPFRPIEELVLVQAKLHFSASLREHISHVVL